MYSCTLVSSCSWISYILLIIQPSHCLNLSPWLLSVAIAWASLCPPCAVLRFLAAHSIFVHQDSPMPSISTTSMAWEGTGITICLLIYQQLSWGPIYKESYARLMTAQHLRRTYAELVNCERLTKNHKLNLRKNYAKLRKNLWPHKCCHKSIIRGNYVILLTPGHFHYLLIKQEDHRIKSMTHLKVFCWNIFERDFSDAA